MFTCGLLRSNFSLLISVSCPLRSADILVGGSRAFLPASFFTALATASGRVMEPAMRFELMTSSLPRRRSTPELRGHVAQVVNLRFRWFKSQADKLTTCPTIGAGDETRTRDPQLGRLMLYQLSY